jgi:hypothetical protein
MLRATGPAIWSRSGHSAQSPMLRHSRASGGARPNQRRHAQGPHR